jgi:hypothetical protein
MAALSTKGESYDGGIGECKTGPHSAYTGILGRMGG